MVSPDEQPAGEKAQGDKRRGNSYLLNVYIEPRSMLGHLLYWYYLGNRTYGPHLDSDTD